MIRFDGPKVRQGETAQPLGGLDPIIGRRGRTLLFGYDAGLPRVLDRLSARRQNAYGSELSPLPSLRVQPSFGAELLRFTDTPVERFSNRGEGGLASRHAQVRGYQLLQIL